MVGPLKLVETISKTVFETPPQLTDKKKLNTFDPYNADVLPLNFTMYTCAKLTIKLSRKVF